MPHPATLSPSQPFLHTALHMLAYASAIGCTTFSKLAAELPKTMRFPLSPPQFLAIQWSSWKKRLKIHLMVCFSRFQSQWKNILSISLWTGANLCPSVSLQHLGWPFSKHSLKQNFILWAGGGREEQVKELGLTLQGSCLCLMDYPAGINKHSLQRIDGKHRSLCCCMVSVATTMVKPLGKSVWMNHRIAGPVKLGLQTPKLYFHIILTWNYIAILIFKFHLFLLLLLAGAAAVVTVLSQCTCRGGAHMRACVKKSGNNSQESVFSFHCEIQRWKPSLRVCKRKGFIPMSRLVYPVSFLFWPPPCLSTGKWQQSYWVRYK